MRRTWGTVGVALAAALTFASPAYAANEDVDPEHTETFNDGEQGYLTFSIPVTLTSAGFEIPGRITGECEFTTTGVPNTSETVLSVVAHATSTATSAGYPVATAVACDVTNAHGGVELDEAAPLTTVSEPGVTRVRYGAFTICLRISALYDENVSVRSKQVCTRP